MPLARSVAPLMICTDLTFLTDESPSISLSSARAASRTSVRMKRPDSSQQMSATSSHLEIVWGRGTTVIFSMNKIIITVCCKSKQSYVAFLLCFSVVLCSRSHCYSR